MINKIFLFIILFLRKFINFYTMKIFMLYDQIQAGKGTKDDSMTELNIIKSTVGPAVMMENYLKKYDGKVLACIYSGDKYYDENKDLVNKKIIGMLNKVQPDILICGPSFNYEGYSKMAINIALEVNKNTSTKAICAMSEENTDLIEQYKNELFIVKTPKKGGTGLNTALEAITIVAKNIIDNKDLNETKEKYCY